MSLWWGMRWGGAGVVADWVEGGRGAYDGAGDAHAFELLLVLGAGLGAVVRHEDDLFAYVVGVGER